MSGVIAKWPEAVQAVTEFRPVNSMGLFTALEAEEIRTTQPSRNRIGVALVHGHQKFEYALFDIMEGGG